MKKRGIAVAALTGVACLLAVGLAPTAGAEIALDTYQAQGVGQGIVATFAARPSIFDPLLQGGLLHTESTLGAQGGGQAQAFSSLLFPGTFVVGAVGTKTGCAGLPGGDYVYGTYPAVPTCPEEQQATLLDSHGLLPSELGPVTPALKTIRDAGRGEVAHVRATAGHGHADSEALLTRYTLRNAENQPIIAAKELRVSNVGGVAGARVAHDVVVTARDLSLLGGAVTIDTMTSRAHAATDGVTGDARASITFAGVKAFANDAMHEATISAGGIKITDGDLSRAQRLGFTDEINDSLLQAGLRITAATPTEITDDGQAEAISGGLLISVLGTVPTVAIPSELTKYLAPVIESIETRCIYELEPEPVRAQASLPLCFGAGVVPGNGNQLVLSLALGQATAFTAAGAGYPPFSGGDVDTGDPGTSVLGGGYTNTTQGPFSDTAGDSGGTVAGGSSDHGYAGGSILGPLLGLVARMPSAALMIPGVLLLVLAVGLSLTSSLRHARAR